jgi:hypothetical protein
MYSALEFTVYSCRLEKSLQTDALLVPNEWTFRFKSDTNLNQKPWRRKYRQSFIFPMKSNSLRLCNLAQSK